MDSSIYWQTRMRQRVTRRGLLGGSVVVAAGVGSALLGGCGARGGAASKPAAGGAAPNTGATAAQPQRGGVFSGRVPTDPPTSWIPAGTITYNTVWPFSPAFNQLVQWDPQDPDNKIVPDLADSYEIAADGKSMVFKLHAGVKFHDGSDFSSEDVKATIEWNKTPPAKMASSQQGVVQVVERVETPDPLTAKFILKNPSPSLIGTLASHFLVLGAKSDLARDDIGQKVNGTGPFKLKAITRGVGVELERNPNYWIKDRPYMDGVKYSIVPDENTAMTDMIAGRFHRYFPVLADNLPRIEAETGGRAKAYHLRAPGRRILFFNGTKKPFNDPRVRQAVSLALDRSEALQVDLRGMGVVGGYLQPGGPWAITADQLKTVPGYDKPDIAEAKKLLAAAGMTEPFSGTQLTRSDPSFQATATYVQGSLKKNLGWNLKLDVKDSAAAFAATAATQFDICTWNYALTFDDPDATFGQLMTTKATSNWSKIFDADADALFDKQSQTLDAAQRKQIVQQLENKYLNNFPQLTMFFSDSLHGIWNTFQNYHLGSGIYVNQRYQDAWLSKA